MRNGIREGIALVGSVLLVTGCADALAPEAAPPTVAGEWSYAAPALSGSFEGSPVACEYGLRMTLGGVAGPTFTGSYREALLVCDLFGAPQLVDVGEGLVVAGSLEGRAVQFDFDSETIRNTGTISGDDMSGQVSIQLVVQHDRDIDTILVTGAWSASR